MADDTGHLRCPFCGAYEVERLYLAATGLDSCECRGCGARWEEEVGSGAFRGRRGTGGAPRERT